MSFFANDTYANMVLNLIFQNMDVSPDTYELVGFDNSPIASEAYFADHNHWTANRCDRTHSMELLVQRDGRT